MLRGSQKGTEWGRLQCAETRDEKEKKLAHGGGKKKGNHNEVLRKIVA